MTVFSNVSGPMKFRRNRADRWLLALSLALVTVDLRADIKLPSPAAASVQAIARAARIWRGGETEIRLAGRQGGTSALQFKITEPPKHGRLSEIRSGASDNASVTYSHDVAQAAGVDTFEFIAETAAGEKSAPATVRIVIKEPPPRLRVSDELDFGEVMAGKTATETLAIANEGGGVLEGKLRASAPWKLSAETFRVPSGETQLVKIIFQAAEPKGYVGQIALTGDGETLVSLKAKALAPLTVAPNPLRLALSPEAEEVRSGTLAITNTTDEKMSLRISPGRYLKTLDTLELPAHETRSIPVAAFRDYPPAIREQLEIAAPAFAVRVPVEAEGLPAKILLAGPAKVEFPSAAPGEARSMKVSLRNEGGRETLIRLQAREPFRAAPAVGSLQAANAGFRSSGSTIFLPAQQEAEVELQFASDVPGQYATLLTIVFDGGKIEIPLSAEVIAPERPRMIESAAAIQPTETAAPTPPAIPTPPAAAIVEANPETERAALARVEVRALSGTEVELKWPRPADPPFGYRIEQRRLAVDANDEVRENWEQMKDARMTEFGQSVSARVRNLRAATVYGLRVLAIDRQGATTMESPALGVITLGDAPQPWGRKFLLWLLFLALAGIGWLRWRLTHA